MSLINIKDEYSKGLITKREYIDRMYDIHNYLFEYASFVRNTNIGKIEISDDSVVMTFRDSGLKIVCTQNDKRLASLDTLNFGTYEKDEFEMQCNLINAGNNIFDIGANYGWYALHIAQKFANSTVYSFEPVPTTYSFLNKNISLNNITNVKTFNFGFSSEEGTFSLYYDPTLSVNASLANVSEAAGIKEVSCKIARMDNFISNENLNIDFIKCDVEGAELRVFEGAKETIAKQRPIIFTEMLRKWTVKFNYSPNDIIAFFKKLGYKCFVTQRTKLKEFFEVEESTAETNYFFLHKEKHFDKIRKYSSNV